MKKMLIAQESSRYSEHKQDFFCFLCIKMFRKKIGCCKRMKITMTAIIERQRARLYTQKAKKIAKRFYIQKAKYFSKS